MVKRNTKILIFSSENSPYAPLFLKKVFDNYNENICALVTVGTLNKKTIIKKTRNVVKKCGWRYALLKLILFGTIKLRQGFNGWLPIVSGGYFSLKDLCKSYGIKYYTVKSIKSDSAYRLIKEFSPDVIFSVLFDKIIDKRILSIPRKASLNLHPSLLPGYAGIAPNFWVLSNAEKETGVSIHYMETEVDKGDIYLQEKIPILPGDSVHSLYLRSSKLGADLLSKSFKLILNNKWMEAIKSVVEASYYSTPTKEAYRKLRKNGFSLFNFFDLFKKINF